MSSRAAAAGLRPRLLPRDLTEANRRRMKAVAVPVVGMLIAAGLVITRRPDAVTHAQFWAEDGALYFANVYNHGLVSTLAVPQDGYFQTFAVLAAGIARLVSLPRAPLVVNVLAIAAQALPVGLLLSARAKPITGVLWIRALLALLYVGLPYASEINANGVNAQWHLATAAAIVLLLEPPAGRAGRVLDTSILLLSGLTGPFCLLLAPLAWLQRRSKGPAAAPVWQIALLCACALLQIAALLIISKHPPAGYHATLPRDHGLAATPALFARLVGGRVLLGSVIGQASGLNASLAVLWPATAVGLALMASAAWKGRRELRLFVAFAGVLFVLGLLRPDASEPLWPFLALGPEAAGRYFFTPQLAVFAALVWAATGPRRREVRYAALAALVAAVAITFPSGWRYPAFTPTGYARGAAAFEAAPVRTTMTFALNPAPSLRLWTMTLTKR